MTDQFEASIFSKRWPVLAAKCAALKRYVVVHAWKVSGLGNPGWASHPSNYARVVLQNAGSPFLELFTPKVGFLPQRDIRIGYGEAERKLNVQSSGTLLFPESCL